ncbi:hypothetical protein L4C36_05365 [Photobacterium japonica]|uniref:hypothetical protein n=1 Tax=Photobacterium japonica TaxID=2910235 RepID=UPI003D0F8B81
MKKKVLLITMMSALSGCNYGNGERSLFWDDEDSVTITREMVSEESGLWTVGACIAIPAHWERNAISVSATGTHQVNGERVSFNAVPTLFEAGSEQIADLYALPDYQWACYTDIERDYAGDIDSGSITYHLSPESDDATIFTTMGVISDTRRTEYFYGRLASHQLLASDTTAPYWRKSEVTPSFSYWESLTLNDGLLIYAVNDAPLPTEVMDMAFHINVDGVSQTYEKPKDGVIYSVNGVYIHQLDYSAEINGNSQDWTNIRFSTDLIDWSEAATLPKIQQVQWDPRDEQYIALSHDYFAPLDHKTYTSVDLSTWSEVQWIDRQSPQVAFLSHGVAVLDSNDPTQPYWLRDSVSDSWTVLEMPDVEQTLSGAVRFNVHELVMKDDRFYTTGLRWYWDDKGDADTSNDTFTNENILFGMSDDGLDWTWKTVGVYDDVGSDLTLTFVGENTLLYSTSQALVVSHDGGLTWEPKVQPTSVLNDDESSAVYQSARIDTIEYVNGEYIGTTYSAPATHNGGYVLFKTQDFERYDLLLASGFIQPIIGSEQWHVVESTLEGIALQTLVVPQPETPQSETPTEETPLVEETITSSSNSGGSLHYWSIVILLLLSCMRTSPSRRFKR